jgi:hypothetical protein
MTVMRKIQQEQFFLTKIKRTKGGLLNLVFDIEESEGADIYVDKFSQDSTKTPHPDLYVPLFEMKNHLAASWGVKDEVLISKISINGISISGAGDKKGVIIMGSIEAANGAKCAMNSPKISIEGNSFGFEEELEICINKLTQEVYLFLFEGKKAQLTLQFDEVEESEVKVEKTKTRRKVIINAGADEDEE